MSKHARDRRPYLRPVTRIELSENNIRLRWVLVIVLVCIAAVAIGIGISSAMEVQPGWNEVQVSCDEPNYGEEFHLMYDFSQLGGDAAAVNKALTVLYSDAMEDAYRIFSKDAQIEEFHNLYYLNRHVNESVAIDEVLYKALELLEAADNRFLYLAPVYVEYNRVFNSESDAEAMVYDPARNSETAEYIGQLMHYIRDENAVRLELLGANQVMLVVSGEYAAFAEEYGIEEYLDLGWMRNAFVADYVAQLLMEQGYTRGYLGSYDGYNRSLGQTDSLVFNIYDRQGADIYVPGKMTYSGAMTIVFLRDYPLSTMDQWAYHVYEDGTITSTMIAPENGLCGTAIPNLVSYAYDSTCAQVLMEMLPLVFAEEFSVDDVMMLCQKGIYSIWCKDQIMYFNQESLQLETVENEQGVRYGKEYAAPVTMP